MPTYSHDAKAGNQGDVAKHAALLQVLEYVAGGNGDGAFWYVDLHAAGPVHDLPKHGAWEDGVEAIPPGILQAYRDFFFTPNVGHGNRYLGSSAAVYKWFIERERQPSMTLFDIEPKVCKELFEFYSVIHEADPVLISQLSGKSKLKPVRSAIDQPQLLIVHGDGYRLAPELLNPAEPPNLVLVDPPKVEIKKRKQGTKTWDVCFPFEILRKLEEANVPFLCWTPINATGDPATFENLTSPSKRMIQECQKNSEFTTVEVLWKFKGAVNESKGCQLTFFRSIDAGQLDVLVSELRKMPQWRVKIRDNEKQ